MEENIVSSVKTTEAADGARLEQIAPEKPPVSGGRKAGLIVGIVVGVLALAYIAACAVVQFLYNDTALPHSDVLGGDVSGQAAQQIEALWEQQGERVLHDTAVTLTESGESIGVLQIAHGVAEYGMRYAPFAEFMTEHGFAVVANDLLGHGLSAEKGADTLYFGPRDGWKHVVDDMYALRCRTKEKYSNVPYFLMGHSMGSFLTRTYLIRSPGTVDAAIIMGTGHQSPAIVAGGRAIA